MRMRPLSHQPGGASTAGTTHPDRPEGAGAFGGRTSVILRGSRYGYRVSQIPWWGLPLIAAVFAVLGAPVPRAVPPLNRSPRSGARGPRRWYEERKAAYV